MERLQRLDLFTGADELDRLTAHFADGQRRTTAGIAIELGQHRPGNAYLLMESTGQFSRFLANHRIHHQQHLIGLHSGANSHHLPHHFGVDLKATGGVDQKGVVPLRLRLRQTGCSDLFRLCVCSQTEHINTNLPTQSFQLLDGSRAIHVSTHHQRATALIFEMQAKLGRCRGFTGPLKAGHQNHRGGLGGLGEGGVVSTHHIHQLIVNHLDELLVGAHPTHHLSADGLVSDLGNKILNHRKADIGFEQRATNLLQSPINIGFADLVLASQPFDCIFKAG